MSDLSQSRNETILTAIIPEALEHERLDTALGVLFPERSRSFWQNRIEEGDVVIVGVTVTKAGRK